MFDEAACKSCESMFLTTALHDGRCKVCVDSGLYGGEQSKVDFIKSEKQKVDELKAMIRELLQDIQEEERIDKQEKIFEPKKCKKCGAEFIPMAAANRYCKECRGDS